MPDVVHVLCPLANDALKKPSIYLETGDNGKVRIASAVAWAAQHFSAVSVLWAFGAGTDEAHKRGPTLATLSARTLREYVPDADVLYNGTDPEPYGTLEEMTRIIEQVCQQYPCTPLRFHVFSQSRHLIVVRQIGRMFFPDVSLQYHETGQTKEVSWVHVGRSLLKLYLVRVGLQRPVQYLRRRVRLRVDQ